MQVLTDADTVELQKVELVMIQVRKAVGLRKSKSLSNAGEGTVLRFAESGEK